MIYLGSFKAGESVPYAVAFHNDQSTVEDCTSPSANLRKPDGTWVAQTAPAKQNNSTGLFGGSINTASFVNGLYILEVVGTVTTAKTVKTTLTFRVKANDEKDAVDGLSAKASQTSVDNITTKVNAIPTNPVLDTDTRLDKLDENVSTRASQVSVNAIPTNPLLASDIRLNDLASQTTLSAIGTLVGNIPSNPLLTNDIRITEILNYLANIPNHPLLDDDIRLTNIINAINGIPTTPLLSDDTRLNSLANLDGKISEISVTLPSNIMTNDDPRLNNLSNLDMKISEITIDTSSISVNLPANIMTNDDPRLDNLDMKLSQVNSLDGNGNLLGTIFVKNGTVPLENAEVWVTTDIDGRNVVTGVKNTDATGKSSFVLVEGQAYYIWSTKTGFTFSNPIQVIWSASNSDIIAVPYVPSINKYRRFIYKLLSSSKFLKDEINYIAIQVQSLDGQPFEITSARYEIRKADETIFAQRNINTNSSELKTDSIIFSEKFKGKIYFIYTIGENTYKTPIPIEII